jgi:hypothetical protein
LKPGITGAVGVVDAETLGNEIDPCGLFEMCCGSEEER